MYLVACLSSSPSFESASILSNKQHHLRPPFGTNFTIQIDRHDASSSSSSVPAHPHSSGELVVVYCTVESFKGDDPRCQEIGALEVVCTGPGMDSESDNERAADLDEYGPWNCEILYSGWRPGDGNPPAPTPSSLVTTVNCQCGKFYLRFDLHIREEETTENLDNARAIAATTTGTSHVVVAAKTSASIEGSNK